ncbi:MAG TPA: class I SAM-dependent methyltransferase [Opitutales bacterium]|jgi:ubiquinone/menaquinone biosynthesis C-methylase UbiE|nr:class I SAM-dependent methyltransferase [Opitutales bacterium]
MPREQPTEQLSTPAILLGAMAMIRRLAPPPNAAYLEIGAGHGQLIELVQKEFSVKVRVCDYTTELLNMPEIKVDVADLNHEPLPYPDATFDLVTCTEVIEHLEHYRFTLREIYRVLKPGGRLVVTTPNILNMKSRARYFCYGFFNLFGPLHFRESALHSTGGHINPVSYFYLAHSLTDAGFTNILTAVDRHQRTSWFLTVPLWIPMQIGAYFAHRREVNNCKTVDASNAPFVAHINSRDILLGRTIILGCIK